nr:immunoglobulin-like and fibronectin type III domain-containing protein 1 [Pelodiscus sinensis]|eukprot:XP_025036840.1 immunoglobulin-like and fibronectin type III domain-containing protein 1 [Pelodiscus sinensis]
MESHRAGKPRKKSAVPGVTIQQFIDVVPKGCSTPDFVRKPVTITLQEGKNATFRAVVTGEPAPAVIWKCSKGELRDPDKYQTSFHAATNEHVLQINTLTAGDTGLYHCSAANQYGEAACTAGLKVIQASFKRKARPLPAEPPEDLKKELQDFRKMLRKRTPLQKKEVDMDQVWQLLLNADRKDYENICLKHGIVDFRGMLRKLQQMKKDREDKQQQYIYSVTNLKHIKANREGSATFHLEIDLKNPRSRIYLYKDGQMINYGVNEDTAKHCLRQAGNKYSFTVAQLQPGDAGVYQIKVEDVDVFSTELDADCRDLSPLPCRFRHPLRGARCREQGNAAFECSLHTPCSRAVWLYRQRPIEGSDKYEISISPDGLAHRLAIRNVQLADEGPYTLDIGICSSSAWLEVEPAGGKRTQDEGAGTDQTAWQADEAGAKKLGQREHHFKSTGTGKDGQSGSSRDGSRELDGSSVDADWGFGSLGKAGLTGQVGEGGRRGKDPFSAAGTGGDSVADGNKFGGLASEEGGLGRKIYGQSLKLDGAGRAGAVVEGDQHGKDSMVGAAASGGGLEGRGGLRSLDGRGSTLGGPGLGGPGDGGSLPGMEGGAGSGGAGGTASLHDKDGPPGRAGGSGSSLGDKGDVGSLYGNDALRGGAGAGIERDGAGGSGALGSSGANLWAADGVGAGSGGAGGTCSPWGKDSIRAAGGSGPGLGGAGGKSGMAGEAGAGLSDLAGLHGAGGKSGVVGGAGGSGTVGGDVGGMDSLSGKDNKRGGPGGSGLGQGDTWGKSGMAGGAGAGLSDVPGLGGAGDKPGTAGGADAGLSDLPGLGGAGGKSGMAGGADAGLSDVPGLGGAGDKSGMAGGAGAGLSDVPGLGGAGGKSGTAGGAGAGLSDLPGLGGAGGKSGTAGGAGAGLSDLPGLGGAGGKSGTAGGAGAGLSDLPGLGGAGGKSGTAGGAGAGLSDLPGLGGAGGKSGTAGGAGAGLSDLPGLGGAGGKSGTAGGAGAGLSDLPGLGGAGGKSGTAGGAGAGGHGLGGAGAGLAGAGGMGSLPGRAGARGGQDGTGGGDAALGGADTGRAGGGAGLGGACSHCSKEGTRGEAGGAAAGGRGAPAGQGSVLSAASAGSADAGGRGLLSGKHNGASGAESGPGARLSDAGGMEPFYGKGGRFGGTSAAGAGGLDASELGGAGSGMGGEFIGAWDVGSLGGGDSLPGGAAVRGCKGDLGALGSLYDREPALSGAAVGAEGKLHGSAIDGRTPRVHGGEPLSYDQVSGQPGGGQADSRRGQMSSHDASHEENLPTRSQKRKGRFLRDEARESRCHLDKGLSEVSAQKGEPALPPSSLADDRAEGIWLRDERKPTGPEEVSSEKEDLVHKWSTGKDSLAGKCKFEAEGEKTEASIFVEDSPTVDKALLGKLMKEPLVVKAGQNATVKIPFEGRKPVSAGWLKDGAELLADARVHIDKGDNFTRLFISSTRRTDCGDYSVKLKNESGALEASVRLEVIDKPQKPRGPIEVVDSSTTGITIRWKPPKDDGGKPVQNYIIERQQVGRKTWVTLGETSRNSSTFTTNKVERDKSYCFRVRAVNAEGTSEALESDEVAASAKAFPGLPAPPMIVSASEESIKLSWTTPPKTGNSKILGYVVEKRKKGSSIWTPITDLPIAGRQWVVAGLQAGLQYEFRVAAVNAAGAGEASAPSDAVFARDPMKPPGRVRDLRVTSTDDTSITLAWMKPDSEAGGSATGYQVEKRSSDSLKWAQCTAAPVERTSYTIRGLRARETYCLRVRAVNEGGLGEAVALDTCIRTGPPAVSPKFLRDDTMKNFMIVKVGGCIRVHAPFEASPTPEVIWLKDRLPLPSRAVVSTRDGLSQLLIPSAGFSDSGLYTIVLQNDQGKKESFCFQVQVADIPQPPGLVRLQENVLNTVTVMWDPSPTEKWEQNLYYTVLKSDSSKGSWQVVRDLIYTTKCTVTNLLPGRAYYFRVVAKNGMGTSDPSGTAQPWIVRKEKEEFQVRLPKYRRVNRNMPPRFLVRLKPHVVTTAADCYMSCAVGGYPKPKVTWYKDGRNLSGDPAFFSTDACGVCCLVIPAVTKRDEGEYEAEASNAVGRVASKARLLVKGPSGEGQIPGNLRTVVGGRVGTR